MGCPLKEMVWEQTWKLAENYLMLKQIVTNEKSREREDTSFWSSDTCLNSWYMNILTTSLNYTILSNRWQTYRRVCLDWWWSVSPEVVQGPMTLLSKSGRVPYSKGLRAVNSSVSSDVYVMNLPWRNVWSASVWFDDAIVSLSLDLRVISRESLVAVGMWCDDNAPVHTSSLCQEK